ncbi:MAG: Na+/H+ antiporter subunit E [Actinobacteria bacterium]|nr:Na+/H+ antiporter subunit E [Actinomycetota bacterium]
MPDHERHPGGPRGGGGRRGAARAWAIWWLLCAALWLAMVDRVALDELLTGAVAAALGATAAVLVRQQRRTLIRPRAGWLRTAWWRQPLALVRDLAPLARALVVRGVLRREQTGATCALRFDAAGDTPRAAAYRVLTATLGSLGPNTIVLEVDADERTLLAHQLVPRAEPARDALPLEGAP